MMGPSFRIVRMNMVRKTKHGFGLFNSKCLLNIITPVKAFVFQPRY